MAVIGKLAESPVVWREAEAAVSCFHPVEVVVVFVEVEAVVSFA